ncbi:MAG TPA: sigma-54 dependent transcriptional regulator [Syntrophorhabdaceae bacterium]|nr:sigma-54 dependent transcriptional regulator [Syntrophorhabdaceae bacterium]
MNEKVVIIEDDRGVRFFLEEALKDEGYLVESFDSYESAIEKIGRDVDLILMDISLPGKDGLTATEELKAYGIPIIIITAYGTKKNALEAIKKGAVDFFVKPVPLNDLKVMVRRFIKTKELKKEIEDQRSKLLDAESFYSVVGRSRAMKEIFASVEKIAKKDLAVLITGETGVGKEEIARLIHKLSKRKGDFVVVNCASIPDNLLESELFGYEKGAFTGAFQKKQGKFELADRGSICLDEIGEMSPYLQAKLLRVVENREFERLGGTDKITIDAKIISTTNKNLEEAIKNGTFREDLFFRLAQFYIHIPPLRERKEDIDLLVDKVLFDISKDTGVMITMEKDVRELFLSYSWPGNVRELINVIKRASAMCHNNHITVDDLPLHLKPLYMKGNYRLEMQHYSDMSLDEAISELEKKMIEEALKKTKGMQAKAAKLLGISERSMWYRVKKYGIDTGKLENHGSGNGV